MPGWSRDQRPEVSRDWRSGWSIETGGQGVPGGCQGGPETGGRRTLAEHPRGVLLSLHLIHRQLWLETLVFAIFIALKKLNCQIER